MPVCCNEPRATPFCPMCGNAIRPDEPLPLLLQYLRTQQQSQESACKKLSAHGVRRNRFYNENPKDAEECHQEEIESRTKSAEKWRRWADALEKLLKEAR